MKKRLIALLSVTSVLAITACGGGHKDEPYDPTAPVTITFWHTMGQNNQDIVDRMLADFYKENPNITVQAFSQGGYDDIAGKITKAIPAGTTPTMAFCYPDNVASYLESGAIEDMTSYIENEEYGLSQAELDDFVQEYWAEGINYKKKGVYSVPFARSTEVMFYNATLFEKYGWQLPTTWDDMWALCETIKDTMGDKVKFPLGYDSDSNLFITKCEQEGIPYTTKEGDAGEHYLFSNPEAKAMVAELKAKYDAGYLVTKGSQPNNTYTSTMFTDGELIMSIGSTGGTTYNKSLNFDVGVAAVPRGKNNGHVVMQGPSMCFFKRATTNQKVAAWKFYKFLTGSDNSIQFAINTGYDPVRYSSRTAPIYQDHLALAADDYVSREGGNLLACAAKFTTDNYNGRYFSSDVFPGSDTARDAVGGIIANVLLNTKTIDDAFQDALTQCVFGE